MSDPKDPSTSNEEKVTLPCDRRYRTSSYFLQDQLRCSEAAADFKSVKDLVAKAPSFNLRAAFQFQLQPIPIESEPPPG